MNIAIEPGSYVAAVSGGVDSVVLLDLLNRKPGLKLTVAHFDHGIRKDSKADRLLVQGLADQHRLSFVFDEGKLGPEASEAKARKARYDFLHRVRKSSGARAVVTAHHQDDFLETAMINLLRGSGRRGLTALKDQDNVVRPLLSWSKQTLIRYARNRGLKWREDSSNADTKYMRNHIRHNILSKMTPVQRRQLIASLDRLSEINHELDMALINYLHMQPVAKQLDRHWFVMLPHNQAREVMAMWLRAHGINTFDTKLLEKLVANAKTLHAGKRIDASKSHFISVDGERLALIRRN